MRGVRLWSGRKRFVEYDGSYTARVQIAYEGEEGRTITIEREG